MPRRWIGSSANQAPLERVLESISQHGGNPHGKLIIVQGEAGAGASAFASRLHSLLLRRKIRSVFAPRCPFNADFVLYSHYLKSLDLPNSINFTAGHRVTRHYEAAIHLRCYQAIIFEDAHDFFYKHQAKIQNIYDSIQHMIEPPQGHCVVFCGLRDPLTIVGHRASGMGIDVEYVDFEAMACDQSYLEFVNDIAVAMAPVGDRVNRLRPFIPSVSTKVSSNGSLPSVSPKEQRSISITSSAAHASPEPQLSPISHPNDSGEAPEQTKLGAASYLALDPWPLTGPELNVAILHAHTKGLVGNTVSVVMGLMAISKEQEVDLTTEAPVSNRLVLNDAFCSTAPASPKPPEHTKVIPGANATDGVIPSICSSDEAFSGANDAMLYEPASSEALLNAESELASAGSRPRESSQFDITSGTQTLLPFMVSECQQIELQLELSLELTETNAPTPVAAPIVTTEEGVAEKLTVNTASGSFERVLSVHSALRNPVRRDGRKRYKAFSGFLTPIHDEALGSWLSRNATSSSVTGIQAGFLDWCNGLLQPVATPVLRVNAPDLSQLWNTNSAPAQADLEAQELWSPEVLLGNPRSHDNARGEKELDCDDLYRSETFLQAFPDLTRQHITEYFRLPINALSPENNRRFCAQCLADDVAAMRAPGLRQAWRNRGAALCTAHRQPIMLQKLEKGHLSQFSGAWQAYMQQTTRGDFDHGLGLVLRSSTGYQVASVETRVCRIVRRIQDWVEYAPAIAYGRQPSKYALYFLLGVFLYQANLVSDGGAARALLKGERGSKLKAHGYEKPTAAQMVKNIESASPRALAIAYLLLGLAFDLINKEELDFLRQTLAFTTSIFPIARGELKVLTHCFQVYHCEAIWNSAMQHLPTEDLGYLAWLLKNK